MLKKYPFVKQQSIKDCASCCVLMIIKYYKGNINQNKLNSMLKITRNGTTAYHIVQTLNSIGFKAYGIKEKIKETKNPFIAHIKISNYYHFVVVYEINKKYILIADPNSKIKKITHQEFLKVFKGIKIKMYPISKIINEKQISIFKQSSFFLKPYLKQTLIIGFLSLLVTLLSIINTFFFQTLIDNINHFKKIALGFIILGIFEIAITYIRNQLFNKLTIKIDKNLTNNIYRKIIGLPYICYQNYTTGEIISKFNDLDEVKKLLGQALIIFISFPIITLSGITIYLLNKDIFYLNIAFIIILILSNITFFSKTNNHINEYLYSKTNLSSFITESIKAFETIKGINIEENIIKKYQKKQKTYLDHQKKLITLNNKKTCLNNLLSTINKSIILIIGIIKIKNNAITLSSLITYIILSNIFTSTIIDILNNNIELKKAIESLKRILSLTQNNKNVEKINYKGDIVFKNVYQTYDDIKYNLKNINLTIKEKNKVLIIGNNGSGKSTLLKTLKGYLEYKGQITIGNSVLTKPKNILITSYNEILFTDTIYNNLIIKDSRNIKANINICQLKNIIKSFELNYNSLIEENGINLSQGQRQRIILARALNNFDILLIDETLNNIDINTERKILKELFKYYKNKTIIVISQRIDNLDLFNQYIKLEKGQIILDETYQKK